MVSLRMSNQISGWDDTIVALATPAGMGAIGVIRLSGSKAIGIVNELFPSKDLNKQNTHTIHVGFIKESDTAIDEVVVSLYKNPASAALVSSAAFAGRHTNTR
jgi:tRNA modification GTPase